MTIPKSIEPNLPSEGRIAAIAAVMMGTTMSVLDSSITNVALPTIARALDVSPEAAIWVVNSYQLANASCLIALAALGDILGYRRVYLAGLVLFTLASGGCAVSGSLESLIVARVFQGLGASAMMSVGPALYRSIFPGNLLGRGLGLSAMTVAAAFAAGPMLGGVILGFADWPWLFAVNLPLGLAALWLGRHHLPRIKGRGGRFDLPGAIMAGLAMGGLVVAVDGLSKHYPPLILILLWLGSLAAGAVFLRWQSITAVPLLPLTLFANRRFSMAAATSLCSFASQGLAFVSLPFLFQGDYGFTPLMSGLLFLPWPLTITLAAPIAGRMADRFSPRILATIGLALLACGLGALSGLGAHEGLPSIIWRAGLCGLGFGFFQSPNNRELLGNVPASLSGAGSGVLASARTFGQSIGAAVAAIIIAGSGGGVVPVERISLSLAFACGAASLACGVSIWRLRDK